MEARSLYLKQPDGVMLHVHAAGTDPPALVFIHGYADGAFVWRHIETGLTDFGGSLAVDLRGHGESDHDPRGCYTVEQCVADVRQVLKQFASRPVVLVGHSLGAEVAVRVAAAETWRVRGVVLVDGGPDLDEDAFDEYRRVLAGQPWLYESVDDYADILTNRLLLVTESLIDSIAAQALKREPDGRWKIKFDRRLVDTDILGPGSEFWQALRNVRCPMLLIRGEGSAVLRRAAAENMVARLPGCRLRVIPLAGHALILERPDAFIEAVREFVSREAQR